MSLSIETYVLAKNYINSVIDAGGIGVGPQGPEGPQGIQGPAGERGVAGSDGQSAYAAAQVGGYVGTQAEFYADLAAMDGMAAWFAAL